MSDTTNGDSSSEDFDCLYCDRSHEGTHFSREHIVPEKISSENYLLSPVCAFRNNYFARAFETIAMRSPLFSVLTNLFRPPKKEVFVGTATRPSGRSYKRFIAKDGFRLHADEQETTSDVFTLRIPSAAGALQILSITLPFQYLHHLARSKAHLTPKRLKALKERVEQDRHKTQEYIRSLADHPGVNPKFDADIQRLGLDRADLAKIVVSIDEVTGQTPPELVTDASDVVPEVATEPLALLLGKIAWTHACRVLGKAAIQASVGAHLLHRLCSAHAQVDDEAGSAGVEIGILSPWTARLPDTLDGHDTATFYFWTTDWTTSFHTLADADIPEEIRRALEEALERRIRCFRDLCSLVRLDLLSEPTQETVVGLPRQHEIRLFSAPESLGGEGTIAEVKLFGGVITGLVFVSAERFPDQGVKTVALNDQASPEEHG